LAEWFYHVGLDAVQPVLVMYLALILSIIVGDERERYRYRKVMG
jgi:hypothetical protein